MSLREAFIFESDKEFSEEELETLSLLQHDKGHTGFPEGQPIPALEKALRIHNERSSKPLFRGLVEKVQVEVGKRFSLKGYSSFSERKEIAVGFSKHYKSDTVLEIHNAHGFNYSKWVADGMRKLKSENPQAYEDADGDFVIESCEEEAEWITPLKSKFHVTEVREGTPAVIVARMD